MFYFSKSVTDCTGLYIIYFIIILRETIDFFPPVVKKGTRNMVHHRIFSKDFRRQDFDITLETVSKTVLKCGIGAILFNLQINGVVFKKTIIINRKENQKPNHLFNRDSSKIISVNVLS